MMDCAVFTSLQPLGSISTALIMAMFMEEEEASLSLSSDLMYGRLVEDPVSLIQNSFFSLIKSLDKKTVASLMF